MISLKRKVSKKINSYVPLLFALSRDEKNKLKEVPEKALKAISEHRADISDWEAVMFRTRVCYEIAKDFYIEQTQKEIYEAVEILEKALVDWKLTNEIKINEKDLETLSAVLEAAEQMHDEISRKQILQSYYRTRTYMKKYTYVDSQIANLSSYVEELQVSTSNLEVNVT